MQRSVIRLVFLVYICIVLKSICTNSKGPYALAICNGVAPSLSQGSTRAPMFKSFSASPTFPGLAASNIALSRSSTGKALTASRILKVLSIYKNIRSLLQITINASFLKVNWNVIRVPENRQIHLFFN